MEKVNRRRATHFFAVSARSIMLRRSQRFGQIFDAGSSTIPRIIASERPPVVEDLARLSLGLRIVLTQLQPKIASNVDAAPSLTRRRTYVSRA